MVTNSRGFYSKAIKHYGFVMYENVLLVAVCHFSLAWSNRLAYSMFYSTGPLIILYVTNER
jgi:hypothetical protein